MNQMPEVCPYGSWYMVGLKMYWKPNPLLKLTETQQREHNIAFGYSCPVAPSFWDWQ